MQRVGQYTAALGVGLAVGAAAWPSLIGHLVDVDDLLAVEHAAAGTMQLETTIPQGSSHRATDGVDGSVATAFHSTAGGVAGEIRLHTERPIAPRAVMFLPEGCCPGLLPALCTIYCVRGDTETRLATRGATLEGDRASFRLSSKREPCQDFRIVIEGSLEGGPLAFSEVLLVTSPRPWLPPFVAGLVAILTAVAAFAAWPRLRARWQALPWRVWYDYAPLPAPDSRRQRAVVACLVGAAIAAVVLLNRPLLDSGFSGDDYVNSMTAGAVDAGLMPMLRAAAAAATYWVTANGRLFPVSAFAGTAWDILLADRLAYKVGTLAFIVLDALLVAWLVRRLSRSRSAGLLLLTLLPVVLQSRDYHDPILSFNPLLQLLTLLLAAACLAFLASLREASRPWMTALGVAMFALALLTYEVAYGFILVFALLWWLAPERAPAKKWVVLVPYLVAWLVAIAASFAVRSHFGVHYEGIALGLSPLAVVRTLYYQTAGAVPLDYVGHHGGGIARLPAIADVGTAVGLILAASACFVATLRLRLATRAALRLMGFGAIWMPLGAGLLALSARYQTEVGPGIAHVPVYLEYFGALMVLVGSAGLLRAGAALSRPRTAVLLALIVAAGVTWAIALTVEVNRAIVDSRNAAFRWPREALENAMHAGLLQGVADGSTVVVDRHEVGMWPLDARLFRLHGGKQVRLQYAADGFALPSSQVASSTWFLLRYCGRGPHAGEVQLAHVVGVALASDGRLAPRLGETWVAIDAAERVELRKEVAPPPGPLTQPLECFASLVPWRGVEL